MKSSYSNSILIVWGKDDELSGLWGRANSKNGKRNGKQCYKCKGCGYQFAVGVDELEKRKAERGAAVALYLFGLLFRAIGRLFSV